VNRYRGDLTKGKIKHGKDSLSLGNDEPSVRPLNKVSTRKKGSMSTRIVRETGLNQILARFLLAKSLARGLSVLNFPLSEVIPVVPRFFAGQITSQGVRLSGTNHRFQNCLDRIRIFRTTSLTNCQNLTLRSAYRPRSATFRPLAPLLI
jgi:hypothetical protein